MFRFFLSIAAFSRIYIFTWHIFALIFQEDESRSLDAFLDSRYFLTNVTLFLPSRNVLSRPKRRLLSRWWAIVASSCDSLIILIRDLNRKHRPRLRFLLLLLLLHRGWFFFYSTRSERSQLSIRDYHSPLICTGSFPRRFIRQRESKVPFADCFTIKDYRETSARLPLSL